jgi:tetratricopeptide (TPR) repeat protein
MEFITRNILAIAYGAGSVAVVASAVYLIYLVLRGKSNPLRRALRYAERGNHTRALAFLNLAVEKKGQRKAALKTRADILSELGRFEEAIRDYSLLLHTKQPGDGIDPFEVRVSLLKPLFEAGSLIEVLRLSRDIFTRERHNAEALYYTARIYLGQLYVREAIRLLERLIANRPRLREPLFAYGIALSQDRRFQEAADVIQKIRDIGDEPLYRLFHAALLALTDDFRGCESLLETLVDRENRFDQLSHYRLFLRLQGCCAYALERYEEAEKWFHRLYDHLGWKAGVPGGGEKSPDADVPPPATYDEFGKKSAGGVSGARVPPVSGKPERGGGWNREYYRLKEVALEERMTRFVTVPPSGRRILDIEGFTPRSLAGISVVFSLAQAGRPESALRFLETLGADHPEILGLKRLARIVESAGSEDGKEMTNTSLRFTDYIREWERGLLKPYHLFQVSGLRARRLVSPTVLFQMDWPV